LISHRHDTATSGICDLFRDFQYLFRTNAILRTEISVPVIRERTPKIMAQKVHITLEDDLDGGDASETVAFGLDGRSYEIDLNNKNAKALRDALATYVAVARRAGGRAGGSKRRTQVGTSAREIRDWARSNGHKVPDRGRIPSDVREAFEAAH
jgi:hypothetical protein